MTITRITNNDNAQYVEYIARSLEETFRRIEATEACIIANFPQISNTPIDFFIWINVPFGHGGYRAGNAEKIQDRPYLNNMAFTIRILEINKLEAVHGSTIFKQTEEGETAELDILAELQNDQNEIERFIKERTGIKYFFCPEVIWLKGYKSSDIETSGINRMIFFDDTVFKMEGVINNVADEIIAISKFSNGSFNSFPRKNEEGEYINSKILIGNVIEAANEGSRYGILTKKKLTAITRLVDNTRKVIQAQEGDGQFCIITGKAGSGKTLALARIMYEIARNKHHARFLTYNSMLEIDMKQTLRALSIKENSGNSQRLDSSNVSCQTIHKFFFDLAKNFQVLDIVSEGRIKELQHACDTRINIAKKHFRNYIIRHDGVLSPNEEDILHEENIWSVVHPADRKEVTKCIRRIFEEIKKQFHSVHSLEEKDNIIDNIFENYKKREVLRLSHIAIQDSFNSDYFKVLEILYAKLVQPEEFIRRKNTMNRVDFLKWVADANPNTNDKEIYREIEETDFIELKELKEQIKTAIRKIKWSNTIFVDEGQDCNPYEKLILQHLKGPEKLVVASGGTDQLIRTPEIIDWTKKIGGFSISYLPISLGTKTHRQKGNIVNFTNRFAELNNYNLGMKIDEELYNVGSIIIDTRSYEDGYIPKDITAELLNKGITLGYSQYESMLFLLPIRGKYVTRISKGTYIQIDEYDNVTEEEDFIGQKVANPVEGVNMWSGVGDSKKLSQFPQHDQSRFIYYESCRGLEACSVLCLDIDEFYKFKKVSKEADRYVTQRNREIFETEEDIRKRFVTIWCTMIFTRAIDTLYIKIKDKNTEFSKTILQAARETPGTRILE